MKKKGLIFFVILTILLMSTSVVAAKPDKKVALNVLLSVDVSDEILTELGSYGRVLSVLYEIDALTMKVQESMVPGLVSLPYVISANPDAERNGSPVDTVFVEDFADGLSTWNLDAINVTDPGFDNRVVDYDGTGVYVAVLDTGLLKTWKQYFPQERIAEEYAISFGGGGGEAGFVSTQPNKWESDVNSHGTHVTSSIIGFDFYGNSVNGVAPNATIIPVKVLNQNGSGWSSVVAAGITYVGDLKAGQLADYPVVINMSLGGSVLDAVEQAAIDYAIEMGVIIVASAGNEGEAGMGYPGAYEPVISVAAAGWLGEWAAGCWWYCLDVADPTNPNHFYIADFSSRELPGQYLDVTAPGSLIVGPYQVNRGQTSYYYLSGTSMASPHVAGTVALMAEKFPGLTALDAEGLLETTALPMPVWGQTKAGAGLVDVFAVLNAIP